MIAVEKVCGAAAERGASLAELAALGRRVAEGSRSLALALSPLAHPGEPRPSFELGDDEVEFGVGHPRRARHRPAAVRAAPTSWRQLVEPVADALELGEGDQVIVIVNGLGATHQPRAVGGLRRGGAAPRRARGADGARARRSVRDRAGHGRLRVTLVRMDAETLALWDAPVRTPALTW